MGKAQDLEAYATLTALYEPVYRLKLYTLLTNR